MRITFHADVETVDEIRAINTLLIKFERELFESEVFYHKRITKLVTTITYPDDEGIK